MTAQRYVRRVVGAASALVLAAALTIIPLGPGRQAVAAVDTISGFGNTASAVTLTWADGITGVDNRTIVAPREPSGSSDFFDDLSAGYRDLTVTVSQTRNLTHQGVQITWTGGATTDTSSLAGNYLQIMQCYGDAGTGPDPKHCQWGGYGPNSLPAGPADNRLQGGRFGNICQPGSRQRCDPAEPTEPDHQYPGRETEYNIPFTPVNTDLKIYNTTVDPNDPTAPTLRTFFQAQSTNEVPVAATSADGTGQLSFEVQTGREATGLGCGDPDAAAGGAPRSCWLVIVPRGQRSPNGATQQWLGVSESALSASNWAQRLQVRLSFLPTSTVCPQDTVQRQLVGTELVANMMTSWQPALCRSSGAVYSFGPTPDVTSAGQLAIAAADVAFTTQPVVFAGEGPPLVYAPVAVTGLTLAFRVDVPVDAGFQQVARLGVSPQLLAKALTQSYRGDLPGGITSSAIFAEPEWMRTVRETIADDPLWRLLNPDVGRPKNLVETMAPMTTADQSAVNRAVWTWIQSEPGTRAWLRGQPDAGDMVINPNYQQLGLADSPPSAGYPRADPMCTRKTDAPEDKCVTSVTYIPYAHNLEDAAVHVQRAFTHGGQGWDVNGIAPDGSAGWWEKPAPKPVGQRAAWAVTAAPFSARYGLPNSSLCYSDGACVAPTVASLSAAVAAAEPDDAGLLHVDPANPGLGGYPLTQIVYAAIRTNQDPAGLRDSAALLEYAAGAGQISGVEVGQLPPGYLPLPDELRDKTRAAAQTLRDLAAAGPSPSPTPSASARPTPSASPTSPGTATPTAVPSSAAPPASATPGPTPVGGSVSQPPAGLAAGSTPHDDLGVIRWVLVAALVAGAVGGLTGLLLGHPPAVLTILRRRVQLITGGRS
ncbi:hypothetical protein ACN27F_17045 [Solwaraspora sp. WMMB335]|uniref:hypothetical protein n=1 Tax=Solwaraspora sp. WMMB335 TaxID=3404118 RepID=UPI003B958CBD